MLNLTEDLKDCLENKVICFLSANGIDLTFETRIKDLTERAIVLINTVPYGMIKDVMQRGGYSLQCRKNRLSAPELGSDGVHIIFPYDSSAVVEETREEERLSYRQHQDIHVSFINPFDSVTKIKKPLLDVSASGLSIRTNFASGLFRKGVRIPSLEIFENGKCLRKCDCEVVYARSYLDLEGQKYCQVGFNIK